MNKSWLILERDVLANKRCRFKNMIKKVYNKQIPRFISLLANSCSLSPGGVVYGSLVAANTSNNWTTISISFNASSVNSTLTLNIEATNQYAWFLDDFSIVDTAGNETLLNGDFESGSLTDWISYPCTSSTCASLVNSNCTVGSTFCYKLTCSSIEVLTQTFPTLPGDTYTFSFQLKYFLQNSGNPANNNKILYRIT